MARNHIEIRNWILVVAAVLMWGFLTTVFTLIARMWFLPPEPLPIVGLLFALPAGFFLFLLLRAPLLRLSVDQHGLKAYNIATTTFVPWSDYVAIDEGVGFGSYGRAYGKILIERKTGEPVWVKGLGSYTLQGRERPIMKARAAIRDVRPAER